MVQWQIFPLLGIISRYQDICMVYWPMFSVLGHQDMVHGHMLGMISTHGS